ncbi:MAG: hypothetical protein RLZZ324_1329 [Candidatus Parcubacteria bacterium]
MREAGTGTRAHRTDQRGIGLMESLAVIGIMTMLLFIITSVFAVNQQLIARSLARTDDDNGATLTIRRIGELVRGAFTVLSSSTINGTVYTTGPNVLVVQIPSVDASGNVYAGEYDYIAIYRDAVATTKIYSDTQTGADSARQSGKKLLTAYNSSLEFSYNNPVQSSATRVSIFLVNTQTVRGTVLLTKAWTSIYLRNH